ncbi:type I polyketide synthase [Nocardia brasiliensis]|uniref:type I polyketide synthase n=1 Tax=Nocardia brasiliensis TaxID=37326 RepID=UPI001893657F|nr:type I polyketide synthase [Nocardia brasiliensis]MBF6548185.1 acyltransferase domain-containing protein [Nocardia brasiliensis]
MTHDDNDFRIAVIGMACRFPGADTVTEYWRNLCEGRESVRPLAPETMPADPPAGYVHVGALLPDADKFDAEFFDMSPREVQLTDPQQRLFLLCAWEALEDSGRLATENPGAVGVFAGAGLSTYLLRNLAGHASLFQTPSSQLHALHGNASDYLATKVSYKLNLTGPSFAVQTACSTSLVAIHQAAQALLDFQCDVALAGGASVQVPQQAGYIYEEGSILSPDGHCRAFDADAGGTVFGSGVGVVVLKRLADALADGDRVHAVILGSAVNNDGADKIGYTAPGIAGQRAVIREALSAAGIGADTIGYVEAHGTGTKLGDPIEIAALSAAYREHTAATQYCALGSVKTNVGHLNSAGGVAGFIKAVLTVRDGRIPASLHYRRPNPEIDFASGPFYVNTELKEWSAEVRRAGVSAFGIGGTNAHVIVEQPPEPAAVAAAGGPRALLISARTPQDADRAAARLAAHLDDTDVELAAVAHTLAHRRRRFPHRRMVVASTTAQAATALRKPAAGEAVPAPAVAWLFPGQGVALGAAVLELAATVGPFGSRLRECADLLRADGFELDAAIRQAEGTEQTQVALFAVEYALAGMWREFGVVPTELLGHSLGELVCATLAGVFELPDALRLMVARGRIMAAAPPGGMLAISQGADAVAARLPEDVWLAADNSATRCVVAGAPAALLRLSDELSAEGAASSLLPVGHAFHTPLMDEAAAGFAELVRGVPRRTPRTPFWSNVTGAPITAEQAVDPAYWARQMTSTVRFREAALGLLARNLSTVALEVGPGKSLVSFLRTAGRGSATVGTLGVGLGAGAPESAIVEAAGRLWLSGVDVDFEAIYGDRTPATVCLPTYPFALKRYWVDPPETAPTRVRTVEHTPAATDASDTAGAEEDEFVAAVRQRVRTVWCAALGVDAVGVDANFFELGGDSLLAVHVATQLRAIFPLELALGELFAGPTVAGMAETIAAHLMRRLDELSDSEVELLLNQPGAAEERSNNA